MRELYHEKKEAREGSATRRHPSPSHATVACFFTTVVLSKQKPLALEIRNDLRCDSPTILSAEFAGDLGETHRTVTDDTQDCLFEFDSMDLLLCHRITSFL
jgi:hypothetical protein